MMTSQVRAVEVEKTEVEEKEVEEKEVEKTEVEETEVEETEVEETEVEETEVEETEVEETEVPKVSENVPDNSVDYVQFPLIIDLAYEMFKWLDRLQDFMNLDKSFDGLWDCLRRIYRKRYNEILINFNRCLDIEDIMDHIGPFVQSLSLKLTDKANYSAKDLVSIQQECTQLKHLAINGFDRSGNSGDDHPFQDRFSDTLETLLLSSCSLGDDDRFFECFTIGKSLAMLGCDNVSITAMQNCFKKNQQIESFACDSNTLDYSQFLTLLPNLKRLGLIYDSQIFESNFLSQFHSLHSLALDCNNKNINEVLHGMIFNGSIHLKALELKNILIDDLTFGLLETFSELVLFVIRSFRRYEFMPNDNLPPKVRHLVLSGFHINEQQFNSMFDRSVKSVKFNRCTYTAFEDNLLPQWVDRRNKRTKASGEVIYAVKRLRSTTQTGMTITLDDFSSTEPYHLGEIAFPALNSHSLTDIEAELDTCST